MERGGQETNETLRLSPGGKDVIDAERGKKETLTPGTPGMGDLHSGGPVSIIFGFENKRGPNSRVLIISRAYISWVGSGRAERII